MSNVQAAAAGFQIQQALAVKQILHSALLQIETGSQEAMLHLASVLVDLTMLSRAIVGKMDICNFQPNLE
jgi:hypothetical protein